MLLRKLSLALVPLILASLSAIPGRAQQDLSGRYAFADTTLLRDTLGLSFRRLFPLADSLETTPDTLRALSIRYRLTLPRLIALAESLQVPIDSVGVTLARERFNPLAVHPQVVNNFSYNTSYNLQQTRNSWINGSDYNLALGSFFVRNVTSIQLDRLENGGGTSLWQTRDANTEVGWSLSKEYSVGGRVVLRRFNTDDPTSLSRVRETQNDYQLSFRTKQKPRPGLSSELNVFSGLLDLQNADQEKHGVSADANGRLRHVSGSWFVHEVSGRLSTSFARQHLLATDRTDNSRDLVGNVNGSVSLFNQARVGLRTAYSVAASSVGQPTGAGEISRIKSSRASVDATLKTRVGPDGYVSLTQSLSTGDQVTALSGPSSRNSNGVSADARATYLGCGLEGRFQTTFARAKTPQASATGGYGENSDNRSLEGAVTRRLFGRLSTRVSARIGLTSYRYRVIRDYGTPPTSRDQGQQSYRIEGTYTVSEGFNSGLAIEVARNQLVNIPSASTAANNTLRSYRGEWHWTYRLLQGLTATQRNTLGANYTSYDFLTGADRLALDYGTSTTLNAVLTPRLSIDLNHTGEVQPSGGWTHAADGLYYFQPADEARSFSLGTRVQYSPSPAVALTLEPTYRSSDRNATVDGLDTPQRRSRTLNFVGSASLNLPIGHNGLLSGSIGRTYFADRSIGFTSGQPQFAPRSEVDYWNGSLQFSWRPS